VARCIEGKLTGTIQNIFLDRGFGFIRAESGIKYYFNRAALKNVKIEDLVVGQECEFEDEEGSRGMTAADVYV